MTTVGARGCAPPKIKVIQRLARNSTYVARVPSGDGAKLDVLPLVELLSE